MDMLALRLYGKEDLRIETIPIPIIAEDEILLKVKAAAVCGTDLRMWKNGVKGIDEFHPIVLSHEFSGVIEKVGNKVEGYYIGQKVSVAPNIGCGICDFCVSGQSHHCQNLKAMGIHMDGGFAEYVRVPAAAICLGNLTSLGKNISFETAAACEAFACVYNSFERYGIYPGDIVVIIGAGAIGLMHAKLALLAGAARVIMNDLSEERLRECKAIEPDITIVHQNLKEVLNDYTDGCGANVVITACSSAAVQKMAFSYAAIDGRVNFFGGLPEGYENVELNTNLIHYKQLKVTGTTRSTLGHYRKVISLVEKGIVDLDALISHRFVLKDSKQAFDNAAAAKGLKQVVVFE